MGDKKHTDKSPTIDVRSEHFRITRYAGKFEVQRDAGWAWAAMFQCPLDIMVELRDLLNEAIEATEGDKLKGIQHAASGFLCLGGNIYEFGGWRFEWHSYGGPWPLYANSDEPVDLENKWLDKLGFWRTIDRFLTLTPDDKAKHLVSRGGCIAF